MRTLVTSTKSEKVRTVDMLAGRIVAVAMSREESSSAVCGESQRHSLGAE